MVPTSGFMRALRCNAIALLGSDVQATKELFQLLDAGAASDYRFAKALLQGRKTLPWKRDWQEKRADPQLLWAHPTSHATGAPDLYTPLSSVLLASPRHRLAAMLQKWGLADEKDAAVQMQLGGTNAATAVASVAHKKAALQFLELPVSSLGGLTARRVKDLGANGNPGDAARSAAAEWRYAAAKLLLESAAGSSLLTLTDARGRTALHHAAASGDARIVEMLLEAGAEPDVKDLHGRTAAHVAAAQRFPLVAQQLNGDGSGNDAFGHSVQSILRLHAETEVATVEAENFSFDSDFIPFYVAVNRPLLIKGGAMHLEAMSWSDYRHLLADLGNEVVQAAPVPYSKNMGLSGGTEAPLAQLLSSPKVWRSEEPNAGVEPSAAPSYIFDASVLRRRRDVVKRATVLGTAFMERHMSHVRVPQFGVGFRGAGAPMHTHHAALNASFAGKKRWFLCPPEVASWSLDPVSGWRETDRFKSQRDSGLLLELEQEPGDLLYIPEGWGHATILESYAVGVAQEFVPWTSIHG